MIKVLIAFCCAFIGVLCTIMVATEYERRRKRKMGTYGEAEAAIVKAFQVMHTHLGNIRSIQGTQDKDGKWTLYARCLKCGKSNRLTKDEHLQVVGAGCGACHTKFSEGDSGVKDADKVSNLWN